MTTDLAAVLRDDPRFHGHAPMLLGEGCSVVAYCGSVLAVGEVLPRRHRSRVASWLDAAPPSERFELVVSHDDLGMEHVLVEDGPGHDPADLLVTGVIDRGDAALCDPAYDLDLVLRDLGPALPTDRALRSAQQDVSTRSCRPGPTWPPRRRPATHRGSA